MKDKLCARDKCDDVLLTANCRFNTYQTFSNCENTESESVEHERERQGEKKRRRARWPRLKQNAQDFSSFTAPLLVHAHSFSFSLSSDVINRFTFQVKWMLMTPYYSFWAWFHISCSYLLYRKSQQETEWDSVSKRGACTMHWHRKYRISNKIKYIEKKTVQKFKIIINQYWMVRGMLLSAQKIYL